MVIKDADFADGIYWILNAIDYKLGGGCDFSCGIDYKNGVFETRNFWAHSDCNCSYDAWQWDMTELADAQMEQYAGEVDEHSSEWWRLYTTEWGNVTQGHEPEHDADCDLAEWYFEHFASGLKVSWYKRVGRSTESNMGMKTLDWHKTVVECLESVRDD